MKKSSGLLKLIKSERKTFLIQSFFYLLESLLSIYLLYMISNLTDLVVANDIQEFLRMLPIGIAAIVLQALSFYLSRKLLAGLKGRLSFKIREKVGNKLLSTDLEGNNKYKSAAVISIYNNQLESIQEFMDSIPDLIVMPVVFVISVIFMGSISIKLLLLSAVLMPVSSLLFDKLVKPLQKKQREIMDQKSNLNEISKDVISGFYVMKSYNLQQYFKKIYSKKVNDVVYKSKEIDKVNSIVTRMAIVLRYIPQLIVPLYGGYLAFKGEMTLGNLIAYNTMIFYVILPIESLLSIKKKYTELKPSIEDVEKIMSISEESYECEIGKLNFIDMLNLDGISFSYEEGKEVLKDINIKLKPKEKIKIIGESGGGKSTLINLICGFNTGYNGKISVAGYEMDSSNITALRKFISYVPQSPYIFSGTVRENITLGKEVEEEELIKACRLADAYDFINKLPQGFDTVVGDGGLKLSGGQAQRVAIARAVIKDGNIFILDEPTSALDTRTESKIIDSFNKICTDKSSIVVTHRLAVIGEDDHVVELKGGRLNEREAV